MLLIFNHLLKGTKRKNLHFFTKVHSESALIKELISRKNIQYVINYKCKKILNRNGIFYTDEEIILVRDALYKLAQIMLEDYEDKKMKSRKDEVI